MTIPLKDLAVKAALENNWQEAIKINLSLISGNPTDLDSYNRLAFSYLKIGKFKKAKEAYTQALVLDKTNPIALRNLKKLETVSKQKKTSSPSQTNGTTNTNVTMHNLFIEEAGKTKTVELKNVTDKKSLSLLQPGDNVFLIAKRSKIFIQTQDKTYIGMLPDNIGMRLTSLIKGGNEYQACIKAMDEKNVTVFVKEVKKMAKFKNQPSFAPTPFTASTFE
jgi:tetratricopeptide (TPR) repeat protein